MLIQNRVMSYIGGVIIGAMMLLVSSEVLCRLLLGTSIEGTIEIVSIFLALAIFLGYSPAEERDHHVKVELLVIHFSPKVRRVVDLSMYVLAIAIVALSCWGVGIQAIDSWRIREALPGADFQVPVYPAKAVCFIGYFAFLIQLILKLIGMFRTKLNKQT